MEKTLKTSSHVHPISPICMKCKGKYFQKDNSARQHKVKSEFGLIPSDCITSRIDGIKCPFLTGKAFENGTNTQQIPQRGDGHQHKVGNY